MNNVVSVTKALLPNKKKCLQKLNEVLTSGFLTNNGPNCRRLEQDLASLLHTQYLILCSNGTFALQLALHAAGLAGKKVITTPFSYVATVSAMLWVGCDVVFADIDEETLNLDPKNVARCMTSDTVGILPVHTYLFLNKKKRCFA